MGEPAIRTFRPGDEPLVVGLWNGTLTRDPIAPELFAARTLGDAAFDPAGVLLAEADGIPAGFAVTVSPGSPRRFGPPPGSGRISGLGVLPPFRRRGLGKALLARAVAHLKAKGCGRITYAAHEYYTAGLDRAHEAGLALLTSAGFASVGEAVAMGRQLYDCEWPAEARDREAALAREGLTVAVLTPADRPALLAFFAAEFPDWEDFLHDKERAGGDPGDIVVAKEGGRVVGFCQRLEADHVGPFGIAASHRNRGLGTVMLWRLLDRIRSQGYRFCWFGETGRAQPYYERAGFTVTRRYAIMTLKP